MRRREVVGLGQPVNYALLQPFSIYRFCFGDYGPLPEAF